MLDLDRQRILQLSNAHTESVLKRDQNRTVREETRVGFGYDAHHFRLPHSAFANLKRFTGARDRALL